MTHKQEHTPTPWEVCSGMIQTVAEHKCKTPGCGVHIPIAYMDRNTGNGTVPVERDENAHFIVWAVNSYVSTLDALKEAACVLEDVLDHIDGYVDVNDGDYGTQVPNKAMKAQQEANEALEIVRKAILKAKGEA